MTATNKPRKPSRELVSDLALTIELCGSTWSEPATMAALLDLGNFPEPGVHDALARCRHEVKGRLTLADIVERIDDGRPSAEEAWAQVGTPSEDATLVSTNEAMEARAEVAKRPAPGMPSMLEEDPIAARMAFKDAYRRIVTTNKLRGEPPRWVASLGHDQAGRAIALAEAVTSGKLPAAEVQRLLGPTAPPLLGPAAARPALPAPSSPRRVDVARQRYGAIIANLGDKAALDKLVEDLEEQADREDRARDPRARAAGER